MCLKIFSKDKKYIYLHTNDFTIENSYVIFHSTLMYTKGICIEAHIKYNMVN